MKFGAMMMKLRLQFLLIAVGVACAVTPCLAMGQGVGPENHNEKGMPVEFIVVFKKDIAENKATAVLDELMLKYRPGIDSSRGKAYFYSTGPKFVVDIDADNVGALEQKLEAHDEVFEVYKPLWDIKKD